LILALVLMLSASDVSYDLTGIVNNRSGIPMTYKSQNVKPVRVTVAGTILATSHPGIFYNSNRSTTGYEGSLEYATSCDRSKAHGTYRLAFRVTAEKNEGSCTYSGDAECESRCSVKVTPKSCARGSDCQVEFAYTIGNQR